LDDLFHVPEGKNSSLHIKCKLNGNEALFYGLDKVEKRKSIEGITGVWIEEASECTTDDFRQLNIRMRGKALYNQMIISFNPIDINHWLKKEFFDIAKPDALTMHSTYKDNPFLDEGTKKELEAFKISDPYYYSVYCLGEWGVLGKTIFPKQIVSERIAYLRSRQPLKVGYFTFQADSDLKPYEIKWKDDPSGQIRIYEDAKNMTPYVFGGDTAGEGSDYFSGHIINNSTGNQAAVLHQQLDEMDYAQQSYCLAMHYNQALVGIEVNYSTYPTRKFEEWHYSRMYMRESPDTFTHALKKSFGFMTGKHTRPLIIAELVALVRESVSSINDIKTLEEMLTFVKNENGRPQAQDGAHDDLLMGLAITYHIRDQQAYTITNEVRIDISKLPQDLQDDYNNADAELKRRLAVKWGLMKGA
jgi:phage terminase large subunit